MTRWTDDPTPPEPSQTDAALRAAAAPLAGGRGVAVLVRTDGVVIGANAAARAQGSRSGALPADVARAIARIAAALQPGRPPRLERVRLPGRLVAETFACSLVTSGNARAVLLATPGMGTAPAPSSADALFAPIERPACAEPPAPVAPALEAKPARAAPPSPAPAAVPALALGRFTWRSGLDGRFSHVDATLSAALGRAAGGLIGSDWDALGAPTVQDRLRAGTSFSGLRVTLPGKGGPFDAEIGGAPVRGEGMRGFGLLLAPSSPHARLRPDGGPARTEPAAAPVQPPEVTPAAPPAPQPELPRAGSATPADGSSERSAPAPATLAPVSETAREGKQPEGIEASATIEIPGSPPARDPSAASADEPGPRVEPPPIPAPPAPPSGLTLAPGGRNVIPLRSGAGDPNRLDVARASWAGLTAGERNAFREIARALGARLEGADDEDHGYLEPEAPESLLPEPEPELSPRDQTLRSLEEALRAAIPPVPAPAPAPTAANDGIPLPEASRPVRGPANEGLRHAAAGGERPILDRLPFGVAVEQDDRLIYANRALLGWTRHADTAALEADGGLAALLEGPQAAGGAGGSEEAGETPRTMQFVTAGERFPVEVRLLSVPWDGGGHALLYVLRRVPANPAGDERLRQAELALREAEATARELRSILDTATDGVALVDRAGTILSLNRSAEALFGFDAAELQGEAITLLFAPESHRAVVDYLDGLASNGVASVLNDGREVIGREREGGLIPLFMTIGRVGEEADKYCAVLRDITQWKRAEEELTEAKRNAEKANLAKSDFLAKISHEIRTPLNAIIGFSEVMMEERFGPIANDRYRTYLRDISASGAHLISLINDLLDLSKIEAGKLELAFASVALNEIIQQCIGIMQPQANRERIIIRSSLAPNLPPVVADPRSMRQIVLNLVSNSIKFTKPGGQVILSTMLSESGEVVIRVRDTGVGMSETDIAIAMEPFRQLPTTGRAAIEGTGLGLPLTKALAEANRATFAIRSAVDAGTLVEITFPSTRVLAE
ncbi:PAS domain S-box protein [Ancylobacter sp. 6x-1]|uniref:histidine kinase n=1 Tax=Ancylobacter crimeensis TaxID=2579147 RepID=A0ABT0D944_9HYPH|nr:histidine kinase dimerization/phospho-acceptor domain-containing protein [Ancylobacter crimeensis]MCK0196429.1 PAS domain S-box protein [Ancylobacter crimeensis]